MEPAQSGLAETWFSKPVFGANSVFLRNPRPNMCWMKFLGFVPDQKSFKYELGAQCGTEKHALHNQSTACQGQLKFCCAISIPPRNYLNMSYVM